jgi:hypothetical protein
VEWEKTFAKHTAEKKLMSKICEEKQTTKPSNLGKESEQTFLQRRYRNGQQVYDKVVNANGSHNKLSPHTCLYGWY